jgi:hypothetical protein
MMIIIMVISAPYVNIYPALGMMLLVMTGAMMLYRPDNDPGANVVLAMIIVAMITVMMVIPIGHRESGTRQKQNHQQTFQYPLHESSLTTLNGLG